MRDKIASFVVCVLDAGVKAAFIVFFHTIFSAVAINVVRPLLHPVVRVQRPRPVDLSDIVFVSERLSAMRTIRERIVADNQKRADNAED